MPTTSRTDEVPAAATLRERYDTMKQRVAEAARRSGRAPGEVIVVAVSKYAEMDDVRRLVALGHQDFGESHVQQLIQRAAMLEEMQGRRRTLPGVAGAGAESGPAAGVRWHFVGHLQRNKVKKVIGLVRLIHSVDSLRLAEEIQAVAFKKDEPLDVLVQVNCSGERSKHGCAVPAAIHLCEQIDTMIHLRVRGLMTMAPYSENPEDSRPTFERCRELFDEARTLGIAGPAFNILSMGMSGDFEVAIECGANLVRIGSSLFGSPAGAAAEHGEDDDEDE